MPRIKLEEALLEEDEQQEIERECMDALEDAEFYDRYDKRSSPDRKSSPMLTFGTFMKKLGNRV